VIFVVEFVSDSGDLSELELCEAQAAPSFGGSDEGAEHELMRRSFLIRRKTEFRRAKSSSDSE
jgi:hypothetical protein